MDKSVVVHPKCECGGALELDRVIVDLAGCQYIIVLYCLVCGEEHVELLRLEDFIEINQILGGLK